MVTHGPRFMAFMREMKQEVLDHYDCITVGEAPCATLEQAQEITNPETGALDMVFQFEHMDVDSQVGKGKWALKALHLPDLKASLSRWQNTATSVATNLGCKIQVDYAGRAHWQTGT